MSNVIADLKWNDSRMFYVVYKEYGAAVKIEYNLFNLTEAREKALGWTSEKTNRLATVFSFSKKDFNPKEEYSVNNQYVKEEIQKVS